MEMEQRSDSEMPGSSEASSSAGTSADSSPAPSPPRPSQQARQVPGLRLSLGLGVGAGGRASPPPTARPWPGGDAPPPSARPPAATEVGLLSRAFTLEGDQGGDLRAACTQRLGVPPQRLRFYELVEARDARQLQGTARLAVEVAGSGFSLQALEEMAAENAALKRQAGEGGSEVEQLRRELAALETKAAALRQRLQSSEALRQRGKKALCELKREFEALHKELTHQAAPHSPAAKAGYGTPAALADALMPGSV